MVVSGNGVLARLSLRSLLGVEGSLPFTLLPYYALDAESPFDSSRWALHSTREEAVDSCSCQQPAPYRCTVVSLLFENKEGKQV